MVHHNDSRWIASGLTNKAVTNPNAIVCKDHEMTGKITNHLSLCCFHCREQIMVTNKPTRNKSTLVVAEKVVILPSVSRCD